MQMKLNKLEDIQNRGFDIIINCTGLGSYQFMCDNHMYPIRGQVIRVKAPWMKSIWFWKNSYIIPNIDNIVLGGTADRNEWDTTPSLHQTKRIIDDISILFPTFQNATIVSYFNYSHNIYSNITDFYSCIIRP